MTEPNTLLDSSTLEQHILKTIREKQPESVEQLIQFLQPQFSLSNQKVFERIWSLIEEGKVVLRENRTSLHFELKSYLLSEAARWYQILVALAFITVIFVFTISENAYPFTFLRYALGSVFVVFLPGYSFTKALFPKKDLDVIERIALSMGMSMAFVPLSGLLLNYSVWGIRVASVTLTLLALTIVFGTVAVIREYQFQLHRTDI